jgi:hypothetical protein
MYDRNALDAVGERVVCPGCGFGFPLPVDQPKGSEIEWQYTLNTLVNRVVDQDCLPHLLALRHVGTREQIFCLSAGLGVLKDGKPLTDFDLFFVRNQAVFAGECKTGNELGEKDLKSARLAAAIGCAGFYFVSMRSFKQKTLEDVDSVSSKLSNDYPGFQIETLERQQLLSRK